MLSIVDRPASALRTPATTVIGGMRHGVAVSRHRASVDRFFFWSRDDHPVMVSERGCPRQPAGAVPQRDAAVRREARHAVEGPDDGARREPLPLGPAKRMACSTRFRGGSSRWYARLLRPGIHGRKAGGSLPRFATEKPAAAADASNVGIALARAPASLGHRCLRGAKIRAGQQGARRCAARCTAPGGTDLRRPLRGRAESADEVPVERIHTRTYMRCSLVGDSQGLRMR